MHGVCDLFNYAEMNDIFSCDRRVCLDDLLSKMNNEPFRRMFKEVHASQLQSIACKVNVQEDTGSVWCLASPSLQASRARVVKWDRFVRSG